MQHSVFYSWQSDSPNKTNRGLILNALENVANQLRKDRDTTIDPVIERDTQGAAGSPAIADTIFKKIENAHVFVADVSIIGEANGRKCPNPNVLIELGFAVRTLSWEKIVLVMNKSSGKEEDLPFDLRGRRVMTYESNEGDAKRAPERKQLESQLLRALRAILANIDPVGEERSLESQTIAAIEKDLPSSGPLTQKFAEQILSETEMLNPNLKDTAECEPLLDAIQKSDAIYEQFSRLVEVIATHNNFESGIGLQRFFEALLTKYYPQLGFTGMSWKQEFDYFKFMGHEYYATLIGKLAHYNRWDLISRILGLEFSIENLNNTPGTEITYEAIGAATVLLDRESDRTHRVSFHSDLLESRHTRGRISQLCDHETIIEGDLLLGMRSKLAGRGYWRPASILHMRKLPKFLIALKNEQTNQALVSCLGFKSKLLLKEALIEASLKRRTWFGGQAFQDHDDPLASFDWKKI